MSWIKAWVAAHATRLLLMRRCPNCGYQEKVTKGQSQEAKSCPTCGQPLLPPDEAKPRR